MIKIYLSNGGFLRVALLLLAPLLLVVYMATENANIGAYVGVLSLYVVSVCFIGAFVSSYFNSGIYASLLPVVPTLLFVMCFFSKTETPITHLHGIEIGVAVDVAQFSDLGFVVQVMDEDKVTLQRIKGPAMTVVVYFDIDGVYEVIASVSIGSGSDDHLFEREMLNKISQQYGSGTAILRGVNRYDGKNGLTFGIERRNMVVSVFNLEKMLDRKVYEKGTADRTYIVRKQSVKQVVDSAFGVLF